MNRITLILLVFLITCGTSLAQDTPKYSKNGFTISLLELDPSPPEVGDQGVKFKLTDSKNQPILDAKIEVEAFMPEMGTMPRMSNKGQAEHEGEGIYSVELEVSMGGSWELPIRITKNDGSVIEFPFNYTIGIEGVIYKGQVGDDVKNAIEIPEGKSVFLSAPRQQLIGVELGKAELKEMHQSLRTVARLQVDESKVFDLQLKYSGNLEKLYANREGEFVKKGDPLFAIYSPELYEAQEIFLQLHRESRKTRSDRLLYRTVKEKLQLWGLSEVEIAQLAKSRRPPKIQTISSPFSGFIVKKYKNEGSFAKKGELLFRIADLSKLWAIAEIFEHESDLVKIGDTASIQPAFKPGLKVAGVVDYVYPYLDEQTRTIKVRIKLDNPKMNFRPGMFADVQITSHQGEMLVVPRRAVLFSGMHKYVFVTKGNGYFVPTEIETGISNENWFQVSEGLRAGQIISYSANFLISSEAQLRNALPRFGEDPGPKRLETKSKNDQIGDQKETPKTVEVTP
ncbi:MAG: efflux RND transporter periplasmic adaptor subunit [SAR324 cluster bacterium]|nr:efflux RND transporter periplasmic adaptor subunit [SAR324 cluster bacterium]